MPTRRIGAPRTSVGTPTGAVTIPNAAAAAMEERAAALVARFDANPEIWSSEFRTLVAELQSIKLPATSPLEPKLRQLRQRVIVPAVCTDGAALLAHLTTRPDVALQIKGMHYAARSEPAAGISIKKAELLEVHYSTSSPVRFVFRLWLAPPADSPSPTTVVRVNVFAPLTDAHKPRITPENA